MDQTTIWVIILAIVVVFIIFSRRRTSTSGTPGTDIMDLIKTGDRIIAEVTDVKQKDENNVTKYYIDARWNDPATNRTYTFTSQAYEPNPFPNSSTTFPPGSYVLVLVDHQDRQKYFVDQSHKPFIIGQFSNNHTGGVPSIQDIASFIEFDKTEDAVVRAVTTNKESGSYYVIARPRQPQPNKPQTYISGLFPTQPIGYTPGAPVRLVYDPNDPSRYYLDLYSQP